MRDHLVRVGMALLLAYFGLAQQTATKKPEAEPEAPQRQHPAIRQNSDFIPAPTLAQLMAGR